MTRPAAAIALILTALPGLAGAGDREETCRARAEQLSGYRPPLIAGEMGKLKFRLSGSLGVGIAKNDGAPRSAPPFAGAASAERRQNERQRAQADLYQRLYKGCMSEDADE